MPNRIPSQVFSEPVINIPGGGLFYLTKQNETISNSIFAGVLREREYLLSRHGKLRRGDGLLVYDLVALGVKRSESSDRRHTRQVYLRLGGLPRGIDRAFYFANGMKVTDKITVTNEDNMELMARYPDKYFDLAIVDPPYGIGEDWKKRKNTAKKYKGSYDNSCIPDKQYFDGLKRVCKKWIVWGWNYYTEFFSPTNYLIVWDKKVPEKTAFYSQFEIAATNIKIPASIYRHSWDGARKENETGVDKIHPHQKPVALYKWILDKYAKPGDKILDTHLGSGSIAIACHDYGFELTACELDAEYYEKAIQRIKNHVSQQRLF